MKRIHPIISAPPPDQYQFYLNMGRIVLLLSVLLLQLLRLRGEQMRPDELLSHTIWAVSAYAVGVLGLSFVLEFVRKYIYIFMLMLFYLLMLTLILQVYVYEYEMQLVYSYLFLSMFLCLFFHRKRQLLVFQVYAFLLFLAVSWQLKYPDDAFWTLTGRFVVFHSLVYLAIGFRIDRGQYQRMQDTQYKHLFERLNDCIMYVDRHGHIRLVNAPLARLTGYREKELLGMAVAQLLPEQQALFQPQAEGGLQAEQHIVEAQLQRKDGKSLWVRLNVAPMEARGRGGFIGICTDISAQKSAEMNLRRYAERLEETNKELEQFSHFASHDLRAPIHTISSMAQLLYQRFPAGSSLDARAGEAIELILGNSARMNKLVDALLVYSSSGVEALNVTQVDMNEVVQDAMDNLAGYIKASDARIEVSKLPTLQGDKIQLTRLMQNMLENAILYRKEEAPQISISALYDPANHQHLITIDDNGIGIETHDFERIFYMFEKVEQPGSHNLGIGLAICKKIVDNHNGRIWIESEKGQGTRVHVAIPAQEDAIPAVVHQKS